jgi:hypothetical protein
MEHDPDVALAKRLYHLQWNEKKVIVRGFPLPECGEKPPAENTLQQITVHMSQDVQRLQEDLARSAQEMKEDKETFEAEIVGEIRDCLNLAGHNKERRAFMRRCIQSMRSGLTRSIADQELTNVSAKGAGTNSAVVFPPSGRSNCAKEKRKKMTGL